MRQKYSTQALVVGRRPLGEVSTVIMLLTEEFGIVRARAQGLRKSSAKMGAALQTFAFSEVVLLRGKDGWRMTGAIGEKNFAKELDGPARMRAGRITDLLQRLAQNDHREPDIFLLITTFMQKLTELQSREEDLSDAAEILTALRLLQLLGFDAGAIPGTLVDYSDTVLAETTSKRTELISRINNSLAQSGL
jgi:DNA repair protein RecO